MIPDGDHSVRVEGHAAVEQAVLGGHRKIAATGTGIDEQTDTFGGVRTIREGGKRPRIAERTPSGVLEHEPIFRGRVEARNVHPPETALGIGRRGRDERAAHPEARWACQALPRGEFE